MGDNDENVPRKRDRACSYGVFQFTGDFEFLVRRADRCRLPPVDDIEGY